ncbi:hypothetical protein DVK01_19245 [Haloarcula sp. Atlit-120R]|nr:hypothetical protein DVK01_19245 [Haloarcula sp. Atlit-120R]
MFGTLVAGRFIKAPVARRSNIIIGGVMRVLVDISATVDWVVAWLIKEGICLARLMDASRGRDLPALFIIQMIVVYKRLKRSYIVFIFNGREGKNRA